ncbi:MAG: CDP-glycerol glycerophosphotransferase family protein [Mogibacterium sp.]|nr:CDP-glycerol glycerophosphotransferase family protein [Mogibacterium sp.]
MDLKAIVRNLREKGIGETIRIANTKKKYRPMFEQWKAECAEHTAALKSLMSEGRDDEAAAYAAEHFPVLIDKGITILSLTHSNFKLEVSDILKKQEDLFNSKFPKQFKKYRKDIRENTIKKQIPAIYAKEAVKPIEKKVIFMENGISPSAAATELAHVMIAQKKYKVIYTGLQIRMVSVAEYYYNAREFIRDMATAKAVFISTANDLLSQFDVRPETKIIQLWHGVGAFKKVGYSTIGNSHFGKSEKAREEYNQYRNYTYVTVAGEEQIWVFEDAFRISRDTGVYKPIGIARTDVFFQEDYLRKQRNMLNKAFPACKNKKLILYAPTFRGSVAKAKAPDKLDIRLLAKSLPDDYVLLIKHHGLCKDIPPIPADLKNKFAFDMNEKEVLTIEGLLGVADILITDYSSVGFEFAIREKPMIFFAYDLDDYIDKRGMYFDYEDITPGPICSTTEEIADYICNLDERFDIEEVRAFRKKYVDACDGHAIERTIALLEE